MSIIKKIPLLYPVPSSSPHYHPIKQIFRFARYYCLAGNAHTIHSPFLYDLYTRVIRARAPEQQLALAMNYREALLSDTSLLVYHQVGTRTGPGKPRALASIARRQAVSPRKGKLLYRLVSYFQPEVSLELGTNLGISTLFLGLGMPGGQVYSIEGSEVLFKLAHRVLDISPSRNIHLVHGLFHEALPDILQDINTLDFVFFDGDHRCQATLDYFQLCLAKANNHTVFAFDDIHWSREMEMAWTAITNHPGVTLSIDLFHLGLVFFKKELSKQQIKLRF